MGEIYSLASALVWAFAGIFFRKSGETVSPFSLNLFRVVVSSLLFHMCLNRAGAGLTAIVNTLYSPFIILFAFLMLGERLAWQQFLGMILIIGGVTDRGQCRDPQSDQHRLHPDLRLDFPEGALHPPQRSGRWFVLFGNNFCDGILKIFILSP